MSEKMQELVSASNKLSSLRGAYRAAWKAACEHDKIDPCGQFVVFSVDNPLSEKMNASGKAYLEAICEVQRAYGYNGAKVLMRAAGMAAGVSA
jgi:hypothetical protein